MTEPSMKVRLRRARERVERATARLAAVVAERDELIREAIEAGVGTDVIADLVQVNRSRVYQIRDGGRGGPKGE